MGPTGFKVSYLMGIFLPLTLTTVSASSLIVVVSGFPMVRKEEDKMLSLAMHQHNQLCKSGSLSDCHSPIQQNPPSGSLSLFLSVLEPLGQSVRIHSIPHIH